MNIGKLFVLEGLDGCGKTTIIKKLKNDFPEALFTREPGGSEYGEAVRQILLSDLASKENPMTHLLGFWSSRSSHFDRVIAPAIAQGKTVFSDRLDASTYAFQIIAGKNPQLEELFFTLREMVISNPTFYPQYIYLKTSVETSIKRAGQKNKDHFDSRDSEYHSAVFEGYNTFFDDLRIKPFVHTLDAEQDIETVYQNFLSVINRQSL